MYAKLKILFFPHLQLLLFKLPTSSSSGFWLLILNQLGTCKETKQLQLQFQ